MGCPISAWHVATVRSTEETKIPKGDDDNTRQRNTLPRTEERDVAFRPGERGKTRSMPIHHDKYCHT